MASFEEQLAELEKVVERLERGDMSLEENVTLFERGVQLSNACKSQLASAERRIRVLLEPESEEAPRFEDLALAVEEEQGDEEYSDEDEDAS
jgi:exodeoxyribonuclease VII small subunit